MQENPSSSKPMTQHYNDWPNAVGFDTAYEEHEPVELPIQGHIPAYAAGTLFRTGIGPRAVNNNKGQLIYKANHWFDGFSQIHRFQLHAPSTSSDSSSGIQKVTYNSRLTSDALIKRVQERGRLDDITFAAKYEPCKTLFQKVQSVFTKAPKFKPNEVNNAVTMSIDHPGFSSNGAPQPYPHKANATTTLCNRTDSTRIQFIDQQTLKPTGLATQANLHPQLNGPLSAAHSEADPLTGEVFNYNLKLAGVRSTYAVYKTSVSTGKTTILASIAHAPAYLHSLFLTEHLVVLCVWNSYLAKGGISVLWEQNLLDAMYFENSAPTTWYVVDRRCPKTEGGKGLVAKYESDPFFAFHTVNAHEVTAAEQSDSTVPVGTEVKTDGKVDILCDISVYPNTDVIHHFYMDNVTSSNSGAAEKARAMEQGRYQHVLTRLTRFRLPNIDIASVLHTSPSSSPTRAQKATVDFSAPTSDSMELPTIHPFRSLKPYRYIYGIKTADGSQSTFVDALIKYDVETHKVTRWQEHGQTPGEAIFLPNPDPVTGENGASEGDRDEDDGVLLSVVLDGHTGKSYLLCLDARNLCELGRVNVGGAIGFGFHGAYTRSML